MDECAAFWVTQPGRGEIRTERLLPPVEGEILVRTVHSGISRGTESLVYNGRVPVSQYDQMRCPFQAGTFPGPVKYGYASVGVVEAVGPGVASDWLAERVFCLHPHQDKYNVAVGDVVRIPAEVPDCRAVLAANMETAVNGLWDAGPLIGDRVAVVGAGAVGCLAATLAGGIPGLRAELVDVNLSREEIAAQLGVGFATPAEATGNADIVLHASGREGGLRTSLSLAGFEGRVVELSWFGDGAIRVPLGAEFHSKRLSIVASQVGHVAPARRARRTRSERLSFALSLLADPRYDCLVSEPCSFADLPVVMAGLAGGAGDIVCQTVSYS